VEELLRYIAYQLEELNRNLGIQNNKKTKRDKQGRPTKEHIVRRYRMSNPEGKKMQCARVTGLSIKTVSKYWDIALNYEPKEESQGQDK
jgi:hypothetical protein